MYLQPIASPSVQDGPISPLQRDVRLTAEVEAVVNQELLKRAHELCPPEFSCRNLTLNPKGFRFIGGIFVFFGAIFLFPIASFGITLSWLLLVSAATTVLRISALIAAQKSQPLPSFLRRSKSNNLPKISLLVPLLHEDKILPVLIKNLCALDYPSDFLEIKLLLEEVDTQTQAALDKIELPAHFATLKIPQDWLQTKPKAMNYALPFLSGDIIGIYDAEDRPEVDQLRKVADHFSAAPANVACIQGRLDFFNSRENWISRCFTIDYAMWFRVLLKGVQRLGVPIPLGGTTIFFRRNVLIEIGGWDAHNVTEDAELGMRLARFGYHCEMLDSTTWEEANTNPYRWVRQRSRWLKGYAMTWFSHMRDPIRLWRDLGVRGFFGFQVIMLAGLTSHLAAPLFFLLWLSSFGIDLLPIAQLPAMFWWGFVSVMIAGELALYAVALAATHTKQKRHLIPYILTLVFYWPLGCAAAYKAVFEIAFAPFYWDKTSHGHSDQV